MLMSIYDPLNHTSSYKTDKGYVLTKNHYRWADLDLPICGVSKGQDNYLPAWWMSSNA